MSKDVITVQGEQVVVREDTAKAFRGVKWAYIVVIIALALMVTLAIGFFLYAGKDGKIVRPANNSISK